jgi:Methyltransferase domain
VVAEIEYWKSVFRGVVAPRVPVLPYVPQHRKLPPRVLPVPTAWKGIESVLGDLIGRFGIGTHRCLEFGVEHGYSTAALSCFFDTVTGVDTFAGDKHSLIRDLLAETSARLSSFDNIQLVRSDYRDWAAKDDSFYDLIHIDIVHTYFDTFACGLWSAQHARCVLFHDTESFPAVKRAVIDISRQTGKSFYNFTESNGLGILTKA